MPFEGDLTQRYQVNSELELTFKVVGKLNTDFETLNYFEYGFDNDSKAPKIDSYL